MLKLSCGHSVNSIYDSKSVAIKDAYYDYYSDQMQPSIRFMEVCNDCYDMFIANDLVLFTREDEENYLLETIA